MKIRMLTSQEGPQVSRRYGEICDLPNAEAKRLIDSGQAELVRNEKRETATRRPPEKARK